MYQLKGLQFCCMGVLERYLIVENVFQKLKGVENLSFQCDELLKMCHEFLENGARIELK